MSGIKSPCFESNYVNEEMNALIEKIKIEMDTETRNEYISQVSKIIREEAAPHSAIVQMNLKEAIDYGVTGIDLFTDGNFRTIRRYNIHQRYSCRPAHG